MRPTCQDRSNATQALGKLCLATLATSMLSGLVTITPLTHMGPFVSDANAQGLDETALPPPREEDDLPIPTLDVDRIPPMWSYEIGLQMSYGEVAYFREVMQPWVGFGVRGGAGRNFGFHRVGLSLAILTEGDVGVHTQIMTEPSVTWDFISPKQVYLGAGIGPSFSYIHDGSTVRTEDDHRFAVAPQASARIGWSETWSRIGRRLFVYAEPKIRYVDGKFSPVAALGFGSGQGM